MFRYKIVWQKATFPVWTGLRLSAVLLLSGCLQFLATAQDTPASRVLTKGAPVEREIQGGQSHPYQIDLAAGQYLKVRIEQRGIDVVLRVSGPDGKPVGQYDDENRLFGQEIAECITGRTGAYTLTVAAKYLHFPAAHYEIQVVELRDATDRDKQSREERRQLAEATKLYRAGKYDDALSVAESLQKKL